MKKLFAAILCVFLIGCASSRMSIPVGTIPEPMSVSPADEQYGHEVLGELTRQYSLDTNDQRIERVRAIVDKLTKNPKYNKDPWHVYVLADPSFKNAAATRGNYIFIWTAMVDELKNDDELAAILAHEVAHVLAGHTLPDPYEQANEILSGVAGNAAQIFVSGTQFGALAQLSAVLVQEIMKGVIVNPETQRKELEADHIGLMLMADAKFDPRKAIEFWTRAQHLPELGGGLSDAFFSSHPTNEERLQALKDALPEAMKRYKGTYKPPKKAKASTKPAAGKEAKKEPKKENKSSKDQKTTEIDTDEGSEAASDFVVN